MNSVAVVYGGFTETAEANVCLSAIGPYLVWN